MSVVTAASEARPRILRHSTAHVMAQAVTRLWPGARYAIGPAIEDGFYYDFELPGGAHFSEDDLARIEATMREIIAEDQRFVREEHSVDEGLEHFRRPALQTGDNRGSRASHQAAASKGADGPEADRRGRRCRRGEHLPQRPAAGGSSASADGEFVDLCRGPHVPTTKKLGYFKLTKVAAAYWRGDERRQQLQRIYGTAWESQAALDEYLTRVQEAERRDHRRLGAELDLFHFPPEIGSGLVVFHPKGGIVRKTMEDYSRAEHERGGYEFVYTPHLAKSTLFEISGHLGWYAEGMYPPMEMEGATYYPKPMNCPMHILIYKSPPALLPRAAIAAFRVRHRLPFRALGSTERSFCGSGASTQDDAHIFCTSEQLTTSWRACWRLCCRLLRRFGLTEFEAELSTRPEKYLGDHGGVGPCHRGTARRAWSAAGIDYTVSEGGGAFYAPKIDVHVRDAIGRRWQVSTIQVDFQLPQRFEMEYVGADNGRHRPYMVHRALFGSVERFFAILVEHYAGAFPLGWRRCRRRCSPCATTTRPTPSSVVDAVAVGRFPGRDVAGRRAARGEGAAGQAGEDPLRARGRRRRRGRRDGRGQCPRERAARARRAGQPTSSRGCEPRSVADLAADEPAHHGRS